jgi:magnesium-transporting ATPase (P-type)
MNEATTTAVAGRKTWHGMDARAVTEQLDVDPVRGLSAGEAAERLRTQGPNKLAGAKKESGFHAFLRQYQDFMQIILLGAAVVNTMLLTRCPCATSQPVCSRATRCARSSAEPPSPVPRSCVGTVWRSSPSSS